MFRDEKSEGEPWEDGQCDIRVERTDENGDNMAHCSTHGTTWVYGSGYYQICPAVRQ